MTASDLRTAPQQDSGPLIQQPAKLMRIASVAKAMLEEARTTPCDSAGCERFKAIYERTLDELSALLSKDLQLEVSYLTVAFEDPSPSPSELRVAQAELVGWLEGLFNGIAATVRSQELAAREQVEAIVEEATTLPDLRPMPGQYI